MRLTRLDFVPAAAPLRGWRVVLLLTGLAVLAVSAPRWLAQQQAVSKLETQLAQARPAVAVKPARPAAQQRELEAQAKAVSDAVRQLNLPIGDLIKTLQPPKDIRVALLSLDVGSKNSGAGANAAGILKITAEARTPQEMTVYTAFLADKPMFESVYLVKHELNAAAAEQPYRFALEARWRE